MQVHRADSRTCEVREVTVRKLYRDGRVKLNHGHSSFPNHEIRHFATRSDAFTWLLHQQAREIDKAQRRIEFIRQQIARILTDYQDTP